MAARLVPRVGVGQVTFSTLNEVLLTWELHFYDFRLLECRPPEKITCMGAQFWRFRSTILCFLTFENAPRPPFFMIFWDFSIDAQQISNHFKQRKGKRTEEEHQTKAMQIRFGVPPPPGSATQAARPLQNTLLEPEIPLLLAPDWTSN